LFTPAVCPGALLPAQFAMVIASPSLPSAPSGDGDAVPHAELAARVASGPGLWTDWLEELDRQGLLEQWGSGWWQRPQLGRVVIDCQLSAPTPR
jgi:hypothetical protein